MRVGELLRTRHFSDYGVQVGHQMQDCVFPEHASRAFSWRGNENDIQRLNEVTGTNLMGIIHRADASLYVRCLLNLANREEKEKEVLTTTKSWFIRGLCPISSI